MKIYHIGDTKSSSTNFKGLASYSPLCFKMTKLEVNNKKMIKNTLTLEIYNSNKIQE